MLLAGLFGSRVSDLRASYMHMLHAFLNAVPLYTPEAFNAADVAEVEPRVPRADFIPHLIASIAERMLHVLVTPQMASSLPPTQRQ
jgi:hypothetical protein